MKGNSTVTYISYGVMPIFQNDDGSREYLLLESNDGFWGFPKGTPENGENPKTTASREAFEEAGLRLKPEHLSFSVHYSYQQPVKGVVSTKKVVLFPVWVPEKKVSLQPSEIKSHRWALYEEAIQLVNLQDLPQCLKQVELHATV